LQAHLKATLADVVPKVLKELAKTNSVTQYFIPRQFSAP
jgi:hypothetical protein